MDWMNTTLVKKLVDEGKLPEVEISIIPSTIVGIGFMMFVVGAGLILFYKGIDK
jgi:hypothetical protein